MVVSVLGVALNYTTSDPSTQSEFKGHEFNQINGQWIGYKDDEKITISTEPTYLELIQVPDISFPDLNTGKIYFTTNPQDNIPYNALLDIQNNLVPKLNSLAIAFSAFNLSFTASASILLISEKLFAFSRPPSIACVISAFLLFITDLP